MACLREGKRANVAVRTFSATVVLRVPRYGVASVIPRRPVPVRVSVEVPDVTKGKNEQNDYC